MVCLGPRKKDKKASTLLSPDDAALTGSRSVKSGKIKPTKTSPNLLGSRTKVKAMSHAVGLRKSNTDSTSPRASLNASEKSLKSTASHNSLVSNSHRSSSPMGLRSRTQASRSTRSPGTGARASMSTGSNGHSRNGSVVSVRKSPIAQMREDFDELKLKNSENEELIAQQKAELEKLRRQLAQQWTSPEKEMSIENSNHAGPPAKASASHSELETLGSQKEDTAHMLQEMEEELRKRENEIGELRRKLRHDKNVPSIIVNQDEYEDAAGRLAERERVLTEKEHDLETQRKKWQTEQEECQAKSKLMEDTSMRQLERLKRENSEAALRLEAKEKELEIIQLQLQDNPKPTHSNNPDDSYTLTKIKELSEQLEAEKQAHENSLRQHEEAMAEKERLLEEQRHTLERLTEMHKDEVRRIKAAQSSNILALKQKHRQAMQEIQERLAAAERHAGQNVEKNMDDEIERILREFEQTEHAYAVQIEHLQQAHETELSDLQDNHTTQVQMLKRNQKQSTQKWTERFIPVDAVSWPAPQPVSILRKTTGPIVRTKTIITAEDELAPASERKPMMEKNPSPCGSVKNSAVGVLPVDPVNRPTLRKANDLGHVRSCRAEQGEDEALFKELEREMQEGKLGQSSLLDL